MSFRRSVFRQLRGKVFVHSFAIDLKAEDTLRGDEFDHNRNVFILAFQGGAMTDERIRRICNAYADTTACDIVEINQNSLQ
jgi:hypothetical protein